MKEEVTLKEKFTKWKVFRKGGESVETTNPMTPSQALKYFKATGVIGLNKKFTSKFFLDTFYEVMDEYWLDDDTYVIVFQDMEDKDGDIFHLEAEYHKDEERITYTRVYEYENVEASRFVSHVFKKQIDEYILQQVGVLDKDSFFNTQKVEVELKLGVPKDMTVGELHEFLDMVKEELAEYATTLYWDKKKVKVIKLN